MMNLMVAVHGTMDGPPGGWGGPMGGGGPFGVIGMFFNLLVLVGLLALIVWGVSRVLSARQGTDSAEEILRQRFARGEIDAEEYERSYEALRKDSPRKDYEDYVREAREQLRDEETTRREGE